MPPAKKVLIEWLQRVKYDSQHYRIGEQAKVKKSELKGFIQQGLAREVEEDSGEKE